MSRAFLAPGQGSRDLAVAIEFAQTRPRGKEWLECAAAAADVPIRRFLEQGGRHLERTEVLQPVLTALSLSAAHEVSALGIRAEYVAGHSLGEIAAWSMAGCIAAEDAITLAGIRGRLMAREAARNPGGLLALVDRPDLDQALALGKRHGWVELGAENAPDEIVLAGDAAALRAISLALPARKLAVAGAWHSSAMRDAVEEFRSALKNVQRRPAQLKIVLNRDGQVVEDQQTIPDFLAEQLTHPIRWSRTLETLHSAGVRDFVTVGPGAILRGLLRKNLGSDVRVFGTEVEADLSRTSAALSGK